MHLLQLLDYFNPYVLKLINYLILFCLVNTLNSLVKLNAGRWHKFQFWDSYFIDFFSFILPIVLYVDVASDSYSTILVFYIFSLLFIFANGCWLSTSNSSIASLPTTSKSISSARKHITNTLAVSLHSARDNHAIDSEMTRQVVFKSIHSLRTMIFVISSVVILAVDFPTFPYEHRKSSHLGMSLMDTGVGFFIMCTSFRVIRVALIAKRNLDTSINPTSFFEHYLKNISNSLVILVIGYARYCILKASNYDFSVNEYGEQWNFFFTLFFVRFISYPFEFWIHKSEIKAFIISGSIGLVYQLMINCMGFYEYILTPNRLNFFEKNKPGIFSTIGYVSMYLGGLGVCLRVLRIISKRNNLKSVIISAWNLFIIAAICFVMGEISYRLFDQDISRKLCNLPFILFMIMFFAGAFMILLVSGYIIALLIRNMARLNSQHNNSTLKQAELFDLAFSFQTRLDSKYMGLVVFLLANIFTGLVNLYFEDVKFDGSDCQFTFIICSSTSLAIILPTALKYYYQAKRSKTIK